MLRTLTIVVALMLLSSSELFAQYPIEVLPGKTRQIGNSSDTLWVLSNAQFDKVLIAGKELKLVKEELSLIKKKDGLVNEHKAESDSILSLITKNRNDYEVRWRNCEKDLAIVGESYDKMKRKNKIYKGIAMVGIPIVFVLGLLL